LETIIRSTTMRDKQEVFADASVPGTAVETPPQRPRMRPAAGEPEPAARHRSGSPLPDLPERRDHLLGPHASLTRMVVVAHPDGLHLRICMALVAAVRQHHAEVTIHKNGQTENAASIPSLLSLAAVPGTELLLSATGPETQQALEAGALLLAGDACSGDHRR
jgi:phosphocarrier protein